MDLNVCSRRVHDGYATIRSRGRNRPRAVYKSDSEELLKEARGPYALPKVSAVIADHVSQVPRWSGLGNDEIIENYGTLRRASRRGDLAEERAAPCCTLNSFSCSKDNNNKVGDKPDVTLVGPRLRNNGVVRHCSGDDRKVQREVVGIRKTDEKLTNGLSKDRRTGAKVTSSRINLGKLRLDNCSNERGNCGKERQHVYAIPNVATKLQIDNTRNKEERSSAITDGNYVPSGDLYRSTVRYMEDINRNIAEIDKKYEELRSANNRNSAYGVINKIAKGDPSRTVYGVHRKRDMAPMPPISPNFGENAEDRTVFEFEHGKSPRKTKSRPNSYGKLPPKILPRSSSIENTSRHSTSSTSSAKSTESLYAISETLTELPKNHEAIGKSKKDQDSTSDSRSPTFDMSKRTDRLSMSCRSPFVRCSEDTNMHSNLAEERRYGTLPYRKPKVCSRPLYKSSENVLDGDREDPGSLLQRSCMSTSDVRSCYSDERKAVVANVNEERVNLLSLCLIDATDVILNGQLARSKSRASSGSDRGDIFDVETSIVDRYSRIQAQQFRSNVAENSISSTSKEIPSRNCLTGRTRHNSLESEADIVKTNNVDPQGGFATLPRRNCASKDHNGNEPPKRLSGTMPVLEPLYEHAVSDPAKPRNTENVIPWWELATRKYRHRSCPSLQAHVVSAFEQSLSNMTQRLQQLTAMAEKKDSELHELRETIERLRKQSAEAGLNNGSSANARRHTLGESEGTTGCTGSSSHQGSSMARQLSADSVTSLNSLSSACSASSHHKKKGWLRSSFSKAFSRSRKNRHGSVSDAEDCKDGLGGELSAPNSPRLPTAAKHESSQGHGQSARRGSNAQNSPEHENGLSGSKSSSALYKKEEEDVNELKKQLREKDMVLTDIRLEALSSAHQLESLKDTVIKMRNEMLNLKQNNEQLQRLVTSKSLTSSQSSLPSDPERRFSMTEVASTVAALSNGDNATTADQLEDLSVPEHPVVPSTTTTSEPPLEQDNDGKRINVAVYLGSEKSFNFNVPVGNSSEGVNDPPHCVIASVCISNKTSWDALDSTVRRCFKEYVSRVDPGTNLGLDVECVAAYHLGEASRCITDSQHPELLPCGYLVGHVKTIYLVLSEYSWLAVDTLIPRSIVQRLLSHLTKHRRVILCGPSGTGKSYLAGKLAHALVDTDAEVKDAAAVATFNVDHKSSKELRQYLAHIAERCDSNAADELPKVIILENLQHAASLRELFSGLLGTRHSSCPAIIGTMNQATCSTTNLQLHHNFRWVLCANHMEPVKGFLGRYLRRKLLEYELRESSGTRNAEMAAVVEWIPLVWLHLNKFLESHSSSDVTIGPRLFLSCPMEVAGSQVWFTDLWNYSVIPYLVEAVREGLTLYGRRGNGNGEAAWEDPTQFITSSYPWIATHAVHGGSDALLHLRPEDVGYDVVTSGHTSGVGASSVKSLGSTHSDTEGDPLLNMLMRLQEAANYSSPHSNDSDSVTSLDSSHTRHSEDMSSSTSSSRGVESAL